MTEQQILTIADCIRVAYLRGTKDPEKEYITETVHELRDLILKRLEL